MKNIEENQQKFIVKDPWTRKKILLSLAGIIILIIGTWISYEFYYLPNKKIPFLQPLPGPTKIRPERTDGMLVPNIDKTVYDALKPGNIASRPVIMMPEPEQPIDVVQINQKDAIEDIIGKVLSDNDTGEQEKLLDAPQAPETPIQSEETSAKVLKIIPVEPKQQKAQQSKPQKMKSFYKAQLASVRTHNIAQKEWERLKKLHSKLLGNLPFSIDKVNAKDHGVFYRLLVGKFQTSSGARAICKKLAFVQQNCIVIKD